MPAPATCLRRRSLQRSSYGPRWACRPRLPERLFEVTLHRALERAAEHAVVTQEALAGVRQPHAALGAAARRALHELEARRALQLAQVAPGVAVRHLERLRRLPERAALLDRLQQPRAAVAEFQVVTKRHPDPELRLHPRWGPRHGPHTPSVRRAPAKPWRSSNPAGDRPRHGPHTPGARGAPAKPWRSSSPAGHGPRHRPHTPAFVAPRQSPGAPRVP